jgi:hypothetical protein
VLLAVLIALSPVQDRPTGDAGRPTDPAPGCASCRRPEAERVLLVRNLSGTPIRELHVSTSSSNNWDEDVLGADMIDPGREVRIGMRGVGGACRVDLVAVLADGTRIVRRGFDICAGREWAIRDADAPPAMPLPANPSRTEPR